MFDYLQPRNGPVVDGLEDQEVVYAKKSLEYAPLRTLVSSGRMGGVISRWTLTPEQRKAIAEGADIYLELSTFHQLLQPIRMAVSDGKLDPRWVKMCLLDQSLTPDEIETLEIVVPGDAACAPTGNELLRGDFHARLERYESLLSQGVGLNYIRALEGLDPLPDDLEAAADVCVRAAISGIRKASQ